MVYATHGESRDPHRQSTTGRLSAVRSLLAMATARGLARPHRRRRRTAAAIPSIQLDKTASGDVLVGESICLLRCGRATRSSNPDAVTEYNTSFRDVLPVGVTYNGGSTSPASYGEPRVITDPGTGQQTLIWQNVADMAPGSTVELTFTATVSAVQNPAGSTVTNNASVYRQQQPALRAAVHRRRAT